MNIYRHNTDQKLYTIEHLVKDIKHLNRNAFAGIYATPYNWRGRILTHTIEEFRDRKIDAYEPEKYVADNFTLIAH